MEENKTNENTEDNKKIFSEERIQKVIESIGLTKKLLDDTDNNNDQVIIIDAIGTYQSLIMAESAELFKNKESITLVDLVDIIVKADVKMSQISAIMSILPSSLSLKTKSLIAIRITQKSFEDIEHSDEMKQDIEDHKKSMLDNIKKYINDEF